MTDTPLPSKPPSRLAEFIGQIARPYAIIAVASATAWSIFDKHDAGNITAAGLILGALYAARAAENVSASRDTAKVEVAKTTGTSV